MNLEESSHHGIQMMVRRQVNYRIHYFFRRICELGPTYGYFPEENKSILIVRSKDTVKAENFRIGNDGNFKITNGFRYLGSFIGEKKLET